PAINLSYTLSLHDALPIFFYEQEFSRFGRVYVATADGTRGSKGFVTDVIENEGLQFDCIMACGPTPMLKALKQRYPDKEVYLSIDRKSTRLNSSHVKISYA